MIEINFNIPEKEMSIPDSICDLLIHIHGDCYVDNVRIGNIILEGFDYKYTQKKTCDIDPYDLDEIDECLGKIINVFDEYTLEKNFLYIDQIHVLNEFRGYDVGREMLDRALRLFSSYGYVIAYPFPMQISHYGELREDDYSDFSENENEALYSLRRMYYRWGFEHYDNGFFCMKTGGSYLRKKRIFNTVPENKISSFIKNVKERLEIKDE